MAGPETVLQEGDVLHVTVDGSALELFDRHLAGPPTGGSH